VVQETFWHVWRKGHLFRKHRGKSTTWMFGITRNLCIDIWRRRQARPKTMPHQEDSPWQEAAASGEGGPGSGNGTRAGVSYSRWDPEE